MFNPPRIPQPEPSLAQTIQARLDSLTKPPGSLGRLEELVLQLGLAQNTPRPSLSRKRIYCFAADHGVTAEGVSAYPKAVTAQMVSNMLAGGAAINALAQQAKAELLLVDMGVDHDFAPHPQLLAHKIRPGSANLAQGPALTLAECSQALQIGVDLAAQAKSAGVNLLGTGEMGIGNTTPATCLYAHFLGLAPAEIAGPGTGLDAAGVRHKVQVIEQALRLAQPKSPLEALAQWGGLEIAGIAGLILGAAAHRIPVVVDGFISVAAALAALRMQPDCAPYLIFSHQSQEGAHGRLLAAMGMRPLVDLQLRLGEGTGAALVMPLLEASLTFYEHMASFDSAAISQKI